MVDFIGLTVILCRDKTPRPPQQIQPYNPLIQTKQYFSVDLITGSCMSAVLYQLRQRVTVQMLSSTFLANNNN